MSKRIPSLNWLRVFEAAARTENFARAAERLAMSPPAVSQQIRALETHLGKALFDRAAAGVTLTEAGRKLLVVVGESISRMEAATAELSLQGRPKLVIGASLTLSAGWLSTWLPEFLEQHPDVSVELHALLGRPEVPPRHAELWIAFGQPPPGTKAHYLFGEHLCPVAHPDLAKTIHAPEDLLDHVIIDVLEHRRNWAQVLNRDHLPDTARVVQVDTTLGALSLAGAKGGIALARRPASADLEAKFGLVPCLEELSLAGVEAYYLLHNAGSKLSAGGVAFQRWIMEMTQKD